ncbi:Bax inhibitor 1-related protein [Corchorus olitorius]|uniref:Bax inhibitor 1-related protein n=1 Tax=Corchorus olitorius TaxID=93759 RepID=A0A1R3KBG0_9ROSI|nr:Bax inhibitor 1-related protein [Corchorus olitorius]
MAFALFESATIDLPKTSKEREKLVRGLAGFKARKKFQPKIEFRLIHLVIEVDPSVVVTALVITTPSFACFSGVALVARRREYLYLGGMISSGVSILSVVVFCFCYLWWFLSPLHVYFGLLVFVGYMVVDAWEIIENAHLGDMDYMKHA